MTDGGDKPWSGDGPRPSVMPGSSRPDEIDVDRGPAYGAGVGVFMFLAFQAMILGLFQSGVISDDVGLWQPLRFAGITQAIYVFPSLLFFVNRKCPRMAGGFAAVAGVVLAGTIVALIVG